MELILNLQQEPTINSAGDVIHKLILNYQKQDEEKQILQIEEQILRTLGGMSKDVSLGNHMLGEWLYVQDLKYVRHGVSDTAKESAMKLVDRGIKNAQERKASKQKLGRNFIKAGEQRE